MRLRLPLARIASVLLFAALCAIVAAWALQLLAPRPPIAPAGAVAQVQPSLDLGAAGRLFGSTPQAAGASTVAAPSNIQVAGVLAAGPRGVALLAIDGKPARAFAVGDPVGDGMTVRSVSGEAVELDSSGTPMRLAAPARPSLAVLTSGPNAAIGGGAPSPALPGALPPLAAPRPTVAPNEPPALLPPPAPMSAGGPVPGLAPGAAPPSPPPPQQ